MNDKFTSVYKKHITLRKCIVRWLCSFNYFPNVLSIFELWKSCKFQCNFLFVLFIIHIFTLWKVCLYVYEIFWHYDVIKWKHFPRNWPLWGESTGQPSMPLTKASDAELRCSLWSARNRQLSKQSKRWLFETLLRSLWRHRNGLPKCRDISRNLTFAVDLTHRGRDTMAAILQMTFSNAFSSIEA